MLTHDIYHKYFLKFLNLLGFQFCQHNFSILILLYFNYHFKKCKYYIVFYLYFFNLLISFFSNIFHKLLSFLNNYHIILLLYFLLLDQVQWISIFDILKVSLNILCKIHFRYQDLLIFIYNIYSLTVSLNKNFKLY